MKSLRIAHISDTHLGYKYSLLPNRDDDFAASWLHACRAIADSSPDLILHSGDVFHSHRPDWKALTAFSQGLDILKEVQVPIFIIAGNHDTSGISTPHTVFTFTSNIHPYVISTNDSNPSSHYLPDLDVDVVLVPHRSLLNPSLDQHIRDIVDERFGEFSILVSHGGILKDPHPHEPGSIAIPHSITEHPWNYMAFGHLHLAQPYGKNGWYSGSTERCGWSDLPASPAWTLVEVSKTKSIKHSQISVPHMQFIDLTEIDCENLSTADVCGEVVRLLEPIEVPMERCHIRAKMTGLSPSAKRSVDMMLRKVLRPEYPEAVVSINLTSEQFTLFTEMDTDLQPVLKSIPEMFKQFVEERQYEDLDFRDRFLARGLDLLTRDYES